jgi:hypothetical protein
MLAGAAVALVLAVGEHKQRGVGREVVPARGRRVRKRRGGAGGQTRGLTHMSSAPARSFLLDSSESSILARKTFFGRSMVASSAAAER